MDTLLYLGVFALFLGLCLATWALAPRPAPIAKAQQPAPPPPALRVAVVRIGTEWSVLFDGREVERCREYSEAARAADLVRDVLTCLTLTTGSG